MFARMRAPEPPDLNKLNEMARYKFMREFVIRRSVTGDSPEKLYQDAKRMADLMFDGD